MPSSAALLVSERVCVRREKEGGVRRAACKPQSGQLQGLMTFCHSAILGWLVVTPGSSGSGSDIATLEGELTCYTAEMLGARVRVCPGSGSVRFQPSGAEA
ncbi:hypothetical protein B0H66DRAFT_538006 [Apodospora peruviana]|uniref:Uncharacterized protein n=1 Tax=Apodospora peruviana TaxID=516989 RepID=A0AAE0LZ20_9PEZI|nr:hypothetical protein B0H66DRAFT_538006 [Apodospora peruviana]